MKKLFFILLVCIFVTQKSIANPFLESLIGKLLSAFGLGSTESDFDFESVNDTVTEVSSSNSEQRSLECYIPENTPVKAIAVINTDTIKGKVIFTQTSCSEPVHIEVSLTGLSPGDHGFHVHEKGDTSNGCTSMLSHYNPGELEHGGPSDETRHDGDLGNIQANDDGVSKQAFTDSRITLSGRRTIIGRGLVIHKDKDDFGKGGEEDSITTGHAGSRIACAVIAYS